MLEEIASHLAGIASCGGDLELRWPDIGLSQGLIEEPAETVLQFLDHRVVIGRVVIGVRREDLVRIVARQIGRIFVHERGDGLIDR